MFVIFVFGFAFSLFGLWRHQNTVWWPLFGVAAAMSLLSLGVAADLGGLSFVLWVLLHPVFYYLPPLRREIRSTRDIRALARLVSFEDEGYRGNFWPGWVYTLLNERRLNRLEAERNAGFYALFRNSGRDQLGYLLAFVHELEKTDPRTAARLGKFLNREYIAQLVGNRSFESYASENWHDLLDIEQGESDPDYATDDLLTRRDLESRGIKPLF